MKKLTPLGSSDFRQIIEGNRYFVDKSMLIKAVTEGSFILLLPRPRRFGKTLNMSMLHYFFDVGGDNAHLFQGLAIEQEPSIMAKQGKHPVIFVTFKDIKKTSWQDTFEGLKGIISSEFSRFRFLLEWEGMEPVERKVFHSILNSSASVNEYAGSLKTLSKILAQYYHSNTVILIDEYDTPVNNAWLHDFLPETTSFLRDFLGAGLKDNSFLEKGVITGILRVAKESIFSGLNNFTSHTVLNNDAFSEMFGFTEMEIAKMLAHFDLNGSEMRDLQDWYNGYQIGDFTIFNPWSVLNYVRNPKDGMQPYWANTSDNAIVQRLFFHVGPNIREYLDSLLRGEHITVALQDNLIYAQLETRKDAVWNLLVFSGYLTGKRRSRLPEEEIFSHDLGIPNKELRHVYKNTILDWLLTDIGISELDPLLEALTKGELEPFKKYLKGFALRVFSYHDTKKGQTETFYHAFLLGLLARTEPYYFIRSNRESGYGRYDICLIPRRPAERKGIVIELKTPDEDESLESALKKAKYQLKKQVYDTELSDHQVKNILHLALAVKGKDILLEEVKLKGKN